MRIEDFCWIDCGYYLKQAERIAKIAIIAGIAKIERLR
jgi:hypothetical protein